MSQNSFRFGAPPPTQPRREVPRPLGVSAPTPQQPAGQAGDVPPPLPARAPTTRPTQQRQPVFDPLFGGADIPDYENAPALPGRQAVDAPPPIPRRASIATAEVQPPPPPRPSKTQSMKAPKSVTQAMGSLSLDSLETKKHLTSAKVEMATDIPAELQSLELDRSSIKLEKEIGSGNFGKVFRGSIRLEDGTVVGGAIKTLLEKGAPSQKTQRAFLLEAQVMMEFDHKYVLKLLGVSVSETPWCMVSELCDYGDLLHLLRRAKRKDIMLTLEEKLRITAHICNAMAYLSSKQFIHRDLAARNCLVTTDGVVKIGDFGMSRLVIETDDYYRSQATDALPFRWMAVESMSHLKFTLKTDVWSFGIFCVEVFTYGAMPYGDLNDMVLQYKVEQGIRCQQPAGCPDALYQMLLRTWDVKPEARPTFPEIHTIISQLHQREVTRTPMGRELSKTMELLSIDDMPQDSSDPYKDLDGSQAVDAGVQSVSAALPVKLTTLDPLPACATAAIATQQSSYLFPGLSRPAAERLLLSQGRASEIDGCFLVRDSASTTGSFSLSVVFEGRVLHYRIIQAGSQFQFLGEKYDTVDELIDQHMLTAGRLPGVLSRPCVA
eukprot:m.14783 g.14783  ORF g.14783 m.14783 type:complete len:606 (-) comp6430_c0_seq1:296-2113(-)